MDLQELYGASFVDWGAVAASWEKRTVSSRLLHFAARRYLGSDPAERADRADLIGSATLPDEVKAAFAARPSSR